MSANDSSDDARAEWPRPIDHGHVKQVLVEYLGDVRGSFSMTGHASGSEYRFDAGPAERARFVLFEDAERFRSFPDFRVRDDVTIDPERDRWQAIEATIAEMGRLLAAPASSAPNSPKKRGRPAGEGIGALVDCWMHCCRGTDGFDSVEDAYNAAHSFLEATAAYPGLPTRAHLPKIRSDAKRRREKLGHCVYHQHLQAIIPASLATLQYSD